MLAEAPMLQSLPAIRCLDLELPRQLHLVVGSLVAAQPLELRRHQEVYSVETAQLLLQVPHLAWLASRPINLHRLPLQAVQALGSSVDKTPAQHQLHLQLLHQDFLGTKADSRLVLLLQPHLPQQSLCFP